MSVLRRLFPARRPAPAPVLDLAALAEGLRQAADDIQAGRATTLDWLYDGELLDVDLLSRYRGRIDAVEADIDADRVA